MTALMLLIGKNKLHYLWAVFCFAVFLFGLGVYFVGGALTPEEASFSWKLAHVGAIMIPVLFLHFVYEFLGKKNVKLLTFFYIISGIFLVADFAGGLFIDNMRFVFNEFYFDSPPGLLYPFYTVMFFGLTAYSHFLLWRGYNETNDRLTKDRIKLFFFGMAVSFAGGGFNFFPVYGVDIYPFMNMTVLLYPLIISYAIIKHQLFDIKLILVELAVFLLNLFLFINIFTSHTKLDYVLNISVALSVVAFSFFLVRGIYGEIRDRERIEELAWERARANEKLRAMETQKTEFVSIASHQLRTPLTIIKGYASMVLEGTFGPINETARKAIEKLYESTVNVASLVEDLLTVSRIEQGRTTIDFRKVNFKLFIKEVLAELKKDADEAKIIMSFSPESTGEYFVMIDEYKLKQAVRQILDNAIRYSVGPGLVSVVIAYDQVTNRVRLSVSDTGPGMTKSQISHIFDTYNSKTAMIDDGTESTNSVSEKQERTHGFGLYIAQEIIEAQQGSIHIKSAGVGQGTTVIVELPPAPQGGVEISV